MAYSSLPKSMTTLTSGCGGGFRAYLLPPYAVGTVYGSGCAYSASFASPSAMHFHHAQVFQVQVGLELLADAVALSVEDVALHRPAQHGLQRMPAVRRDGRGSAETSPRGSVRVASVSNRRERDGNDARLEKITRGETLSRRARGWRRRGPPRTCTGASRASCLKARSWSMDPGSERRRARPQWQPRGRKRRARSLTTETRSPGVSFLTSFVAAHR